jgi:hypothetical protein
MEPYNLLGLHPFIFDLRVFPFHLMPRICSPGNNDVMGWGMGFKKAIQSIHQSGKTLLNPCFYRTA